MESKFNEAQARVVRELNQVLTRCLRNGGVAPIPDEQAIAHGIGQLIITGLVYDRASFASVPAPMDAAPVAFSEAAEDCGPHAVILYSPGDEEVAKASIPRSPFGWPPEIIQWGSRYFVRDQGGDYREALCYVIGVDLAQDEPKKGQRQS